MLFQAEFRENIKESGLAQFKNKTISQPQCLSAEHYQSKKVRKAIKAKTKTRMLWGRCGLTVNMNIRCGYKTTFQHLRRFEVLYPKSFQYNKRTITTKTQALERS